MVAVALAHTTALAARGGETAELAVLHHGLACGGERRTVSSRDSPHVNRGNVRSAPRRVRVHLSHREWRKHFPASPSNSPPTRDSCNLEDHTAGS